MENSPKEFINNLHVVKSRMLYRPNLPDLYWVVDTVGPITYCGVLPLLAVSFKSYDLVVTFYQTPILESPNGLVLVFFLFCLY